LQGTPRRFALDAPVLVAQGLARIGESDWLAGARYIYLGASARFERNRPAEIALPELESRIGRISLVVDYDSRDNIFTPSEGSYVEMDLGAARPGLGGSTSFDSVFARAFTYVPLGKTVIAGLRGDGKFTRGEVPFYARPFVMLRGVPAMRYQGRNALVAETEWRYKLDPRWTAVGFAGAGKAYGDAVSFADAKTVGAGGVGVRYLVARKLGLHVGVDIARGPEDTVVYLQVGSAWN
jgi:outer membrane protein assembly factor BamA